MEFGHLEGVPQPNNDHHGCQWHKEGSTSLPPGHGFGARIIGLRIQQNRDLVSKHLGSMIIPWFRSKGPSTKNGKSNNSKKNMNQLQQKLLQQLVGGFNPFEKY